VSTRLYCGPFRAALEAFLAITERRAIMDHRGQHFGIELALSMQVVDQDCSETRFKIPFSTASTLS
jgi:hypothetical protein